MHYLILKLAYDNHLMLYLHYVKISFYEPVGWTLSNIRRRYLIPLLCCQDLDSNPCEEPSSEYLIDEIEQNIKVYIILMKVKLKQVSRSYICFLYVKSCLLFSLTIFLKYNIFGILQKKDYFRK